MRSLVGFQVRAFGVNFLAAEKLTLVYPSFRVGTVVVLSLVVFHAGHCQSKEMFICWGHFGQNLTFVPDDNDALGDDVELLWAMAACSWGLTCITRVNPRVPLLLDVVNRTIAFRGMCVPVDTLRKP